MIECRVNLSTGEQVGSGCYLGSRLVATAAHVLLRERHIRPTTNAWEVQYSDGARAKADLVHWVYSPASHLDFAILEVGVEPAGTPAIQPFDLLRLSQARFVARGFGERLQWSPMEITLEFVRTVHVFGQRDDPHAHAIMLSATQESEKLQNFFGMSGSPVVSEDGGFLGVMIRQEKERDEPGVVQVCPWPRCFGSCPQWLSQRLGVEAGQPSHLLSKIQRTALILAKLTSFVGLMFRLSRLSHPVKVKHREVPNALEDSFGREMVDELLEDLIGVVERSSKCLSLPEPWPKGIAELITRLTPSKPEKGTEIADTLESVRDSMRSRDRVAFRTGIDTLTYEHGFFDR